MYAHALTYPSLRTRSARRVRALRSPRVSRRPLFLGRTTQHLLGPERGRLRAVPRARSEQTSWTREIARASIALANVAALTALLYLFF